MRVIMLLPLIPLLRELKIEMTWIVFSKSWPKHCLKHECSKTPTDGNEALEYYSGRTPASILCPQNAALDTIKKIKTHA